MPDFVEQLHSHLHERPVYDDEVIKDLGRVCRVGMVSEESMLNILEIIEGGHDRLDQSMRGMTWAEEQYAQVFDGAERPSFPRCIP